MSSAYKVLVPPSVEPITLSDAKDYLNVDFSSKDLLIANTITRARSLCETITARAWATQTIQQIFTIERPIGGELSGPINPGPNWYQFQQQLGANPFGPSQYYFDLAMPPIQSAQPVTVQTKITAFDQWTTFSQITNPDGSTNTWIDDTTEPARMYFQDPVTANFWKFQFTAGYWSGYPLPADLMQCLCEGIAYFYEFREAQDFPKALKEKLLAKRSDWV